MVTKKRTKLKIFAVVIMVILFIAILYFLQLKKVKIIYFTNSRCTIAQKTDKLIDEIREDFANKIHVEVLTMSMYPDDPADTEHVKQLREKYGVHGVPEIIIDGKEFTKEYTKDNLVEEICERFLIKPEVC